MAKPGDDRVMFDFVSGDEYIHKCSEMFGTARHDQCRLDVLFITPNGTQDTAFEGLVTVWDLAGEGKISKKRYFTNEIYIIFDIFAG